MFYRRSSKFSDIFQISSENLHAFLGKKSSKDQIFQRSFKNVVPELQVTNDSLPEISIEMVKSHDGMYKVTEMH